MLDDYASAGTTMDNIDTISLYEGEKTEHKVYKQDSQERHNVETCWLTNQRTCSSVT